MSRQFSSAQKELARGRISKALHADDFLSYESIAAVNPQLARK